MEEIYIFEKYWEDGVSSGHYFGNAAKTFNGAFEAAKNYIWHPEEDGFSIDEIDETLWRVFYMGEEVGEISKTMLEE